MAYYFYVVALRSSPCEPRRRNHSIQPSKPCSRGFGIVILYKSLSLCANNIKNRDNLKRSSRLQSCSKGFAEPALSVIQLSLSSVL
ncbi:unnamed protein product [Arctia plantaginis]|uniref:Uncharacterized protein n=1 Tax=Arctia plantaginis TaxID=874455 RepID=A0A8S1AY23_ARCPL|nr:unnamed protein product [Arctia plantaginis]CAB3253676.1 unnamed protein product [Arctia plantaginis]